MAAYWRTGHRLKGQYYARQSINERITAIPAPVSKRGADGKG